MDSERPENIPPNDDQYKGSSDQGELRTIRLKVPEDLYRAFQRCTWIQINESGRSQLDIMEEVVTDFLLKYEC